MLAVNCLSCGAQLQLPDSDAGKTVACPACHTAFTAPASASDAISATPPPAAPVAAVPTDITTPDRVRAGRAPEPGDVGEPRRPGSTGAAAAGIGAGAIVLIVLVVFGCCLAGPIGIALLLPAVQKVREAAARTQTQNNLMQIGLAFHNHNDAFRRLPTPRHQENGKEVELSWRVTILPFIEQAALFNQIDRTAAWDSPRNQHVRNVEIKVYQSPRMVAPPTMTPFQVFTGPNTLYPPDAKKPPVIPQSFPDGTSNTFLVAEGAQPVPWPQPADMDIQPNGPLPLPPRFLAVMGDTSVRFVDRSRTSDATLRLVIDPREGQVIPPDF